MSEPTLYARDGMRPIGGGEELPRYRPATDDDLRAAGLFRAEREVWWCEAHDTINRTGPYAPCNVGLVLDRAADCRLVRRPLGPPLDQPAVTIRPVKEMKVELEGDDE